jgi:hypothetical protein
MGVFSPTYAQKKYERQLVHDRVVINSPDSTVVTFVWPIQNREVKPQEDKVYYWFKADKVRTSRGGYGGKVLHGDYTVFYIDQNLKEKGRFSRGLKTGTWKSWYPNGELKEIVQWSGGQRHGVYKSYRSDHTMYRSGEYEEGQLLGKMKEYDEKGKLIVPPQKPKTKPTKLKKTKQGKANKRFLFFFKKKGKDSTATKKGGFALFKKKSKVVDTTGKAMKKKKLADKDCGDMPCPELDKKKKVPAKTRKTAAKKEEQAVPPLSKDQ